MEILAILSIVRGIRALNVLRPERTLYTRSRCRIRAIRAWVQDRIALEVDIEGFAARPEVAALRSTVASII